MGRLITISASNTLRIIKARKNSIVRGSLFARLRPSPKEMAYPQFRSREKSFPLRKTRAVTSFWTSADGNSSEIQTAQSDGTLRATDNTGHPIKITTKKLSNSETLTTTETTALASDEIRACIGQGRDSNACADGNSVDFDVQLIGQTRICNETIGSEIPTGTLSDDFGSLGQRVQEFTDAHRKVILLRAALKTCQKGACASLTSKLGVATHARDQAWQNLLAINISEFRIPEDMAGLPVPGLQELNSRLNSICFSQEPYTPENIVSCGTGSGATVGYDNGGQYITNLQALGAFGGSSSVSPLQLPW